MSTIVNKTKNAKNKKIHAQALSLLSFWIFFAVSPALITYVIFAFPGI